MDKLSIRIELGNEAMQTGTDIAKALRELAGRIERDFPNGGFSWSVDDDNGNTVGNATIE